MGRLRMGGLAKETVFPIGGTGYSPVRTGSPLIALPGFNMLFLCYLKHECGLPGP